MGRVLVTARIENMGDLYAVQLGVLSPDKVRSAEVADALVDTGASTLSLPTHLINSLGLDYLRSQRVRSATGSGQTRVYGTARLTIQGRACPTDVLEVPDDLPDPRRPDPPRGDGLGRRSEGRTTHRQPRPRRGTDLRPLLTRRRDPMLDISFGNSSRRCDGVSRRDFLRVGALGGLALPTLLRAAEKKHKDRAKSVLLVYLGGGLSHHDSFDPKPDAPAEVRGKYSAIPTSLPRPARQRHGAAHGPHHAQGRPRAFRRAQQRPPRNGDQLGHVGPLRLGLRRLPGHGCGRRPRDRASPANCRPTSPCRATPPSPGNSARAPSWAAATSRSRPATPTPPASRSRTSAPAQALDARRATRRKDLLSAVDDLARKVEGNGPDLDLRRVPAARRRHGPVESGPQRLRRRSGER